MKLEGRDGSSSGIKSDGERVRFAIEGESYGIRSMLEEEMFIGRPHTVGNMRRFLGGNGFMVS